MTSNKRKFNRKLIAMPCFFQIEYFVALLRNMFIIPERTESTSLTQQCENELALYKRLEEKESIVAFLQESVQFCRMVSEAMPLINLLLMSKQAGDVSEAIDFFTTAHHFNIDSAKLGVANMLLLVWSPDQVSDRAKLKSSLSIFLMLQVTRSVTFASFNMNHNSILQSIFKKTSFD